MSNNSQEKKDKKDKNSNHQSDLPNEITKMNLKGRFNSPFIDLPNIARNSYIDKLTAIKPLWIDQYTKSFSYLANTDFLTSTIQQYTSLVKPAFDFAKIFDGYRSPMIDSMLEFRNSIEVFNNMHNDSISSMINSIQQSSQMFMNVKMAQFGQMMLTDKLKTDLFSSITNLTKTTSELYSSFLLKDKLFQALPPVVEIIPSRELFSITDLSYQISKFEPHEIILDYNPSEQREEIDRDNIQALEIFAPDIEDKLNRLLLGAIEANESLNPDKNRHVFVSLRELITHTLHHLAPDDKIHAWSDDVNLYCNNNPTREARLLYIMRNINHPPLNAFCGDDIKTTLKFISIFQRGTHELESSFTESQLKALISKTRSMIRFLFELSKIH